MLPENETGKTPDGQAKSEQPPVHRNRKSLAIAATCFAIGLAASVPVGWAYDYGVQSVRLFTDAARLVDVVNNPAPIRRLFGVPVDSKEEIAPLAPADLQQQGANRFPIRTRFLKRFRRAPT